MMPETLDRAGIARRIPHQGSMCLLDTMVQWTPDEVHCTASNHADAHHPMRTASGLLTACAIEYAAQAMALHGGLIAQLANPAAEPTPGYLASVRNVRMLAPRLDDAPGPLHLHAHRLSGDERQVLYGFAVRDGNGRLLADGRAVVVLNTPLPAVSTNESGPP
jgi:predicted hotdog family 3-hydroxylacyl-ACP dehydratase